MPMTPEEKQACIDALKKQADKEWGPHMIGLKSVEDAESLIADIEAKIIKRVDAWERDEDFIISLCDKYSDYTKFSFQHDESDIPACFCAKAERVPTMPQTGEEAAIKLACGFGEATLTVRHKFTKNVDGVEWELSNGAIGHGNIDVENKKTYSLAPFANTALIGAIIFGEIEEEGEGQ